MKEFSFSDFLQTAPGLMLRHWEVSQYNEFVQDAFGWNALQIGGPQIDTLHMNRIARQWLCDDDLEALTDTPLRPELKTIQAESGWLPFAGESFDLVTLPHTLDFATSAHQTLREASRVLVPEGRLILTVFNPLSLWWWRQRGIAVGLRPYLPTKTAPVSLYRLKDWLALLGFEVDRGRFGIYSPCCRTHSSFERWRWLDKAGDRWAPHCANLIVLSAVKRLPGMKLVGKLPASRPLDLLTGGAPLPVPKSARRHAGSGN